MTVAELIEFLKTQPQNLVVGYSKFSEYCTLDENEISQMVLGPIRSDGWIPDKRGEASQIYLIFPGN